MTSSLSKESEEHQVSTLLYCLGEEAEDFLESIGISDGHRKEYSQILSKLDAFFYVRKNVIINRTKSIIIANFLEEPAQQFIASLYNLAIDCQYGELKSEMIRDRILVGIYNSSLSERPKWMTLGKAKTVFLQREAIHEQHYVLKSNRAEHSPVEAVSHTPNTKPRRTYKSDGPKMSALWDIPTIRYPARDSKCH